MYCRNDDCPDWTQRGVRGEYASGVELCPRCGARLAEGPPTTDLERGRDLERRAIRGEPVVAAELNQRHDAELAAAALIARGIATVVVSDDCGATDPALGFARTAKVLVGRDDLAAARALLGLSPPR